MLSIVYIDDPDKLGGLGGGAEPPSLDPGIIRVIIHVVWVGKGTWIYNMDDNPNNSRA